MGMWIGRGRKARIAYGFDDIALVPGAVTVNSNEVDIAWELCGRRFDIPIIAAAMDGVVGPRLAAEMGRLGGLAVLNLEGIQTRYEDPDQVLERIISARPEGRPAPRAAPPPSRHGVHPPGLQQAQEEPLDSPHRRQLRHLRGLPGADAVRRCRAVDRRRPGGCVHGPRGPRA